MSASQLPALCVEADSVAEQYLTFSCAGGLFGASLRAVREIIEVGSITRVPLMPSTVRGVINLRGAVLPVIDLARRLGHASSEIGRRSGIVILEIEEQDGWQRLGVLVDAVSEVVSIAAEQIEPPPAFGSPVPTDFVQGIGSLGERFVILLALERALSHQELGAIDVSAEAA